MSAVLKSQCIYVHGDLWFKGHCLQKTPPFPTTPPPAQISQLTVGLISKRQPASKARVNALDVCVSQAMDGKVKHSRHTQWGTFCKLIEKNAEGLAFTP